MCFIARLIYPQIFRLFNGFAGLSAVPVFVLLLAFSNLGYGQIYKWVDKNGKVHFSDQKPSENKIQVEDFTKKYHNEHDFEVNVEVEAGVVAIDIKNKIIIAVKKVRAILQNDYSVDLSDFNHVTIKLYKERASVAALYNAGKKNGEDRNVPAFYRPRDNTAHIWQNRNFDRLLATINHEITHALLRHRYRKLPTWLNEGAAEYFEQMQIAGLGAQISISPYQLKRVSAEYESGSFLRVEELTRLPHRQFHINQNNKMAMYGWSGALFFYLSSEESKQNVLLKLFEELPAAENALDHSVIIFERYYPGGLVRLQRDFERWLDKEKPNHIY